MIVDRYYYNQLNKQEQTIYKAFYKGVMEHKDIIPIPVRGSISEEVYGKVFFAMTRDNPLIYFLNQSACSYAQDSFGHAAICPQYFFSKDKVKEYNRKIEIIVNGLAAKLRLTEGSDYEKELKVHDWICNYVSYDNKGSDMKDPARVIAAHNIIGVFAHNRAQCEGIAKAVKVLLNVVNVRCIVVTGNANGNGQNGPHAWNIVNIENTPYQLDATWDIGVMGTSKDRMSYDYFNLTDKIMLKDHRADSVLPVCHSDQHNYFVNNKLSFKSRTRLLMYIENALRKGQTEFYFRIEGRIKVKKMINEISSMAAQIMAEKGQHGVQIQQSSNVKVGTWWIRIIGFESEVH